MADREEVAVAAEAWSEDVRGLLGAIFGGGAPQGIDRIAERVRAGSAVLLTGRVAGDLRGAVVVAAERGVEGLELFVLAAAALPAPGMRSWYRCFLPMLDAMARQVGAVRIVGRADDRAVIRFLEILGFTALPEVVLVRAVPADG